MSFIVHNFGNKKVSVKYRIFVQMFTHFLEEFVQFYKRIYGSNVFLNVEMMQHILNLLIFLFLCMISDVIMAGKCRDMSWNCHRLEGLCEKQVRFE